MRAFCSRFATTHQNTKNSLSGFSPNERISNCIGVVDDGVAIAYSFRDPCICSSLLRRQFHEPGCPTGKERLGDDDVLPRQLEGLVFERLANPPHERNGFELCKQRRALCILDGDWKTVRLLVNLYRVKEISASVMREGCLFIVADNHF